MIESFLSVGTQVLILFLMIGTGFVLGKLRQMGPTSTGLVESENQTNTPPSQVST